MRTIAIILATLLVFHQSAVAGDALMHDELSLPCDTCTVTDSTRSGNQGVTQLIEKEQPAKRIVVKRVYKYKEQLGLALFMMIFVVIMMTSADEFNPGRTR